MTEKTLDALIQEWKANPTGRENLFSLLEGYQWDPATATAIEILRLLEKQDV